MKTFKKIAITAMALTVMTTSSPMLNEWSNSTDSSVETSISLDVSAAESIRKCYTINSSNTNVYSNTRLTSRIGAIYGSDEVIVYNVTSKYCYVGYPTSRGEKKGYISTSAILLATKGKTVKASNKITTYKRASTSSTYGSISKNDTVIILGEKNGFVQTKYPVSRGYKYAFVKKSDAQKYLGYGGSSSSSSTKPTVYKQSGNSWSNYRYGWYYNKYGEKVNATIGSSGCGIVSLTNAVKYLNGTFINPTIIAKYSLDNGYRINNEGTAYGLYKSFCNNRGKNYGIKFVTNTKSYSSLRKYLSNGNVAIIHVPGHIMTCVSYQNGKYLILDSSPNKSRGTSSGYAWKTEAEIKNMKVVSDFYVIGKR